MPELSHLKAQAPWLAQPADTSVVDYLAATLACPTAIARLFAAREILTPADADAFLHPTLAQLHPPNLLLGMAPAVARILQAIHARDPILIYGDYDVDGTTATVLLKTAIERAALTLKQTATVTYHVPHRIREGYGMQTNVLGLASDSGIRLVISVDTGIRAFAAAAEARALGLDLIITDHHLPAVASPGSAEIGGIPDALAVINPNQPTCPYPNKNLCGAAVAFKLAHALLLAVAPNAPNPAAYLTRLDTVLLPSFLKLVAIATIADSVPLTGENRAIAALGLAALANPVQPGLRALMQVAKLPLDRAPTATEVGFRIAPRINAAGRMDIAGDVVDLFLTRNPRDAQALAEKLDTLNHARRATEAEALAAIEQHLLTLRLDDGTYPAACLILDDPAWHRGVLGILASRIVDRTGRPALVLTHSEADGNAHGSGRSIPGFHLLDCLTAAHTPTQTEQEIVISTGAPGPASETWVEQPRNAPPAPLPPFRRPRPRRRLLSTLHQPPRTPRPHRRPHGPAPQPNPPHPRHPLRRRASPGRNHPRPLHLAPAPRPLRPSQRRTHLLYPRRHSRHPRPAHPGQTHLPPANPTRPPSPHLGPRLEPPQQRLARLLHSPRPRPGNLRRPALSPPPQRKPQL